VMHRASTVDLRLGSSERGAHGSAQPVIPPGSLIVRSEAAHSATNQAQLDGRH